MASDNPNALTWIFSYQLVDSDDPTPELALLKPLADVPWIQYVAFHVVENVSLESVYIRGIVRCYRPRTHLQMKSLLPHGCFKPLRGMFTPTVVADKLRSITRLGELFEFGTITPVGTKRSLECSGSCSLCCSNKRSAI